MAEEVLNELQSLFERAKLHQDLTLLQILNDNMGCDYLRAHSGSAHNEITEKQAFKALLPLIDYQDIQEYVDRIAEGDASPLLCNYPVISFSISSGTTAGKSKKFPCTLKYDQLLSKGAVYLSVTAKRLGADEVCSRNIQLKNPKVLSLVVAGKQFQTKAGHTVGSALTNFYRGQFFREAYPAAGYCSPIEVVLSEDGPQAIYCHLLCGLLNSKDVWCFDAGFSFNMDSALNVLTSSWQRLCEDIRHGTLNSEIRDPELREAMEGYLRADPELADAIERNCRGESSKWKGILRRLWPNAVMIQCRVSGPTMKSYVSRINYYSDDLPIYGLSYGVSEGGHLAIALSLQQNQHEEALYTFLPNMAFYEFIPLKTSLHQQHNETLGGTNFCYSCADDGQLQTVEIDGVQIGKYYQPVVTNFQGLYRYKLDDVIKIKGFSGESPTFEFICRKNVILGVNTDKTDEAELQMVVEKASNFLREHGFTIVEYTSSVNMPKSPGNYVIFLELSSPADSPAKPKLDKEKEEEERIMNECSNIIDGSFNHAYKKGRSSGKIGALELCVVEAGTFQKLLEEMLQRGTCISQYKPPRSLPWHSPLLRSLLLPAVLKSCTSSLRHWNVYDNC